MRQLHVLDMRTSQAKGENSARLPLKREPKLKFNSHRSSSSIRTFTPPLYILEHAKPRRSLEASGSLVPGLRRIRPLPRPDGDSLRMRHHSDVPSIRTTQADDALRRPVGIEWVLL